MFAYALVLLLFSPVIFLTATLKTRFSSDELTEMGIRLENSRT